MSNEQSFNRLADFFGRPHRWADTSLTDRRRFDKLWSEECKPQHDFTVVERAAVLRCCREKRDELNTAIERLKRAAMQGDKVSDTAARTLEAELTVLRAAIRVLWQQSGVPPPADEPA